MPALALVIAKREIKETVTDWRILLPMLTLALLFPGLMVSGMTIGLPYMDRVDPTLAGEKAALFGATMAAFFPISFSLIIALESFAGEKERNTLEALLATPVSDGELFLGKVLAVLAPPTFLSVVGLAVFAIGALLAMDLRVAPDFLLLALVLSLVQALVMVAAAVIVSSQTASVKAANLLASFIIIPVALVVQGEVILLLIGFGHLLWFILLEFLLVAVVLVRMGIRLFNREEILTRENNDLHLTDLARLLLHFWRQEPRAAAAERVARPLSLVRLYRTDLLQLLGLYRGQLGMVALMLVAGGITGYVFALQHPLELPLANLFQALGSRAATELADSLSPVAIFVHNLRTLALAGLLSLFTLGIAGLVMVVLTAGSVGFLAGQVAMAGLDLPTFFLAFILPHGVFELPALALAGALNLWLGMCLMTLPKGQPLGDALLLALVNWAKGAAAFVPLLLVAAVVEAKVTPLVVVALYSGAAR
ncbi:MAG: stage II sporulation protein M [Chloroflexi bacterium]|nr:stage II sporulation protein M [Chloroflexota bacterium]